MGRTKEWTIMFTSSSKPYSNRDTMSRTWKSYIDVIWIPHGLVRVQKPLADRRPIDLRRYTKRQYRSTTACRLRCLLCLVAQSSEQPEGKISTAGIIHWPDQYASLHVFQIQKTDRVSDAGKSTLIKMLIELHEQTRDASESTFPSPVVGLPRLENASGQEEQSHIPMEHMPTSADVHLYADPVRFNKKTPLLYADCEGLEGGEKLPVGAQENRTSVFTTESSIARLTPGRLRPLAWADTEKKRTRNYFVKQMYPRILYTLSDVVVFVVPDANSK
jgi:hypothetical protein